MEHAWARIQQGPGAQPHWAQWKQLWSDWGWQVPTCFIPCSCLTPYFPSSPSLPVPNPASFPLFPCPQPCLSPSLPHFPFFPSTPSLLVPVHASFPLLPLSSSLPHPCPHPCFSLIPTFHPSHPVPDSFPFFLFPQPCLAPILASYCSLSVPCPCIVLITCVHPSLVPIPASCPCIVPPSLSHVSMSLPHVLIPPHPIPACLLTPPLPTPGHARQRGTSPGNRGTCCGDRTPGTREGDSAPRPAPPSRAAPVRPSRSKRHRRGPAVPAPLPWGLGRKVPKNRITSFRKSRDGSRAGKTSRAATGKKNAENIQNRETRINTLAYG